MVQSSPSMVEGLVGNYFKIKVILILIWAIFHLLINKYTFFELRNVSNQVITVRRLVIQYFIFQHICIDISLRHRSFYWKHFLFLKRQGRKGIVFPTKFLVILLFCEFIYLISLLTIRPHRWEILPFSLWLPAESHFLLPSF